MFSNLLKKRSMNDDTANSTRSNYNSNTTTMDDVDNDTAATAVDDYNNNNSSYSSDHHHHDDENDHHAIDQPQQQQSRQPLSFYCYSSSPTSSSKTTAAAAAAAVATVSTIIQSGTPSKTNPHHSQRYSVHHESPPLPQNDTSSHLLRTSKAMNNSRDVANHHHLNGVSSGRSSINGSKLQQVLHRSGGGGRKTTTFLDDCESGISMNCRCRKATVIMMTFLVAIFIAFYSNISLVIKLGSAQYYNADGNNYNYPYRFDETYHHLQQMMISSPTVVDNISQKSRLDTAMIGDDDDPLERAVIGDDDETTTSAFDSRARSSPADMASTVSSPTSPRPKMNNRNKKHMKYSKQKQQHRSNNNGGNKLQRTGPKKNTAKANIQDIEPTPEAMSVNASFSACLLIKDDNEILSEWIAYHYHTIKLRHLIVAVDPLSSESPTNLLAKWKLMTDLNIRLWHDEHYMPEDFMETGQAPSNFIATETDLKNSKMRTESIIEISNHRYRQRVFLSSCLRSMRADGNSWVIHIDTDEYVVPSKLLRQMKPRYVVIPPIEQPGSVLSLIQQVVEKTARNVNYPCISMLRVLFGSVESSIDEQSVGVPALYNATAFESLRWRYHALPHHAELHGNPKVILDVQAIPAKYFDETIVFSIHRPVREYCPKNSDLAFSNFRKQPIAVNHYLGSWERYSGRNDKRRSRDKYDLKASVNRGHDDGLRTWLSGFVETMGPINASKLLGAQYLINNNIYQDSNANATTSI